MALFNPAQITIPSSTSGTSTPTSVAANITSVMILAANSNRKGATIWNNGTANLFIEFGATATASAFVAKISAGGYFELPFCYTGIISGIWDVANGNALVRELT
jgi:hypothetical protein